MRTWRDRLGVSIELDHVQVDEFRNVGVIERRIHLLARERRDICIGSVGLPRSKFGRKLIKRPFGLFSEGVDEVAPSWVRNRLEDGL